MVRAELRTDGNRARGIERVLQTWLVQVPQDKITNLYEMNDLADPQTAAQAAIVAGTQAPGTPITSVPPCV